MDVQAKAATSPTTQDNSSGVFSGQNGEMFMQLLMAQLQAQDPLSPMDTNQMVSQLTQLDTLNEVTNIRELVQSVVSPTTGDAQ